MRPATAPAQTIFARAIRRDKPVLGAVLWAGIGIALCVGAGAILAGAALASAVRAHRRGVRDAARAHIALAAATLDARAAAVIQAAIVIHAACAAQRVVGLAILLTSPRRAAARQLARVGHRRIAHIALTARVVPAPIARA